MLEVEDVFYKFGPFSIRVADRLLLRDEQPLLLTPKAFEVLLALVENKGRVVEKDSLMRRVWPDTFVEEGNLTQNISIVRKALGESRNGPRFIETVPKRGYRFAAPVKELRTNGSNDLAIADTAIPATEINRAVVDPLPEVPLLPVAEKQSFVQPSPTHRFKQRLPALFLSAVAILIALFGINYFSGRGRAVEGEISSIQSIAVLPFVDDGAGADVEFLDDEISESLVNSLSKLPKLRVVPRSVMVNYKGRTVDPREIGKELNVRAVVTGRVHRRGDTISIQADLVDLDSVSQIWGQHYDRKLSDILLVQEEISHDIFENLRLRLNVEEQKQLEAYRLYLKGRNAWNKRTADGLKQGIEFFRQAINTDPTYAAAYAGLADCYNMLVVYGVSQPNEAFPDARDAAVKALEMDETLAEAHASLAFTKFRWDRDRADAEREFLLAIKYKPTYAPAHQWYSSFLVAYQRFDEAIAEAKRAQQLEPLSFVNSSHLAWILYLSGKNDEAIEECNGILKLDPNTFAARRYLGLAYEQKGMYAKAIIEFQKGAQLSGSPLMLALLGHAYAASGDRAKAHQVLTELAALESQRYVSPYTVAAIHTALGNKDEAFKLLGKAYEERDVWLVNLKVDPVFAKLRTDRRYQDLLSRANLLP